MNSQLAAHLDNSLAPLSSVKCRCILTVKNSSALSMPVFPMLFENGAGDGNRTHVASLEGWSSTIELHPPPENRVINLRLLSMVGRNSGIPGCPFASDELKAAGSHGLEKKNQRRAPGCH